MHSEGVAIGVAKGLPNGVEGLPLWATELALEASQAVLDGHGDLKAAVALVASGIDMAHPLTQAKAWHGWLCRAARMSEADTAKDWLASKAARGIF